jgi:predicted mannosyl-3-phosphoglycerate phosphatase (HAD superfamily)
VPLGRGTTLAQARFFGPVARLAQYSEPIVAQFQPVEREMFLRACSDRGLSRAAGGRFLGITGRGADKGRAVELLANCYRRVEAPATARYPMLDWVKGDAHDGA